jgi:hypothetical protein
MVCVVLALALTVGPGAHADSFSIEEWGQWNVVSTPISPGEVWQRYETPEEAGWSSEKLSHVLEAAQSAGSAAGMVVYNGAVVTQWGEIERRFLCHSIRKSLLSALYGPAVRAGYIDLEETIEAAGIDDDSGLTPIEKSAKISDLLRQQETVVQSAAAMNPEPIGITTIGISTRLRPSTIRRPEATFSRRSSPELPIRCKCRISNCATHTITWNRRIPDIRATVFACLRGIWHASDCSF